MNGRVLTAGFLRVADKGCERPRTTSRVARQGLGAIEGYQGRHWGFPCFPALVRNGWESDAGSVWVSPLYGFVSRSLAAEVFERPRIPSSAAQRGPGTGEGP